MFLVMKIKFVVGYNRKKVIALCLQSNSRKICFDQTTPSLLNYNDQYTAQRTNDNSFIINFVIT